MDLTEVNENRLPPWRTKQSMSNGKKRLDRNQLIWQGCLDTKTCFSCNLQRTLSRFQEAHSRKEDMVQPNQLDLKLEQDKAACQARSPCHPHTSAHYWNSFAPTLFRNALQPPKKQASAASQSNSTEAKQRASFHCRMKAPQATPQ